MSTPSEDRSAPVGKHRHEEMLRTESLGRLLAKMSIPAMVAMAVNALYNVVDAIFIGRGVGPLAIGGLTIAFPFQILTLALALMLGTGAASVVSRALGSRDRRLAARTAGTTMTVAALLGVAFAIVGGVLAEPILRLFGATENLLPYASEYLKTIVFGVPFLTMSIASNHLIRSEGNARYAMFVMIIGAVLNMILDPVFIFALNLGIRGAATASVIGQAVSWLASVAFFVRRRSALELKARDFIPSPVSLKPIFALGIPAFIRQFGGTFLAVLVNNVAARYGGDLAVASFGAINRILIFALMPIFGLAQGYQPIAGYNYGAGDMARVRRSTGLAVLVAAVVTTGFLILMLGMPRTLLSAISNDPRMLEIAVPAMRTVVLVLPLVGLQVIGATFFLAAGKAIPSLILGMLRQIILLIPLVAILAPVLGLRGLWLAFPIADGLAAAITMVWLLLFVRTHMGKSDHAIAAE